MIDTENTINSISAKFKNFAIPLLLLSILLLETALLTFLTNQRRTKYSTIKAKATEVAPIQLNAGQSLDYEATGLLPNQQVTLNIWRVNPLPISHPKIGLAGVFLPWENLPEFLSVVNRNYGDRIIGTSDDVTPESQMQKHLFTLMTAGIKTIGFGIEWKRVEPTNTNPSTFNWTIYDTVFDTLKSFSDTYGYNFEPVVFLDTPPRWITSAKPQSIPYMSSFGKFPPKDLWTVPIWDGPNDPTPQNPNDNLNPNGSPRYNRFVKAVVERYKPNGTKAPTSSFGIRHFVIWNEANWEFFRDPSDPLGERYMPSLKPYAYLLKGASDTIRTIDPSLTVLTSGFADGDYSWAQTFSDGTRRSLANTIDKLYAELQSAFGETGKASFDIINVHTYKPVSELQNIFSTVATIKASKGDANKKIWLTEWGCDAQECLTDNQSQMLAKWQQGKQILERITDLEKYLWWSSRGYFLDDLDANAAITLQPTPGRSAEQWSIFAGMLYSSFQMKSSFSQLAKDTGALYSERVLTTTADSAGILRITIPGDVFSVPGKYLIFYSQDRRINTELPTEVQVTGFSPTPTPIPPSETFTIKVTAKGFVKNTTVWPKLRLYINHPVGTVQLQPYLTEWTTSGNYQDFTYSFNTNPNQIDLVFYNRYYNAATSATTALYLSSVSINGIPIFPSGATCFFDSGSENRAFDGSTTNATCFQNQPVWSNGSFRFTNLPSFPTVNITPTFSPTPLPTNTPTPTPTQPPLSTKTVTINARGFVKNTTVYPQIKLYINYQDTSSQPVQTWTTNQYNTNYAFDYNGTISRLDIVFPNQQYNEATDTTSALYINKIQVGGIEIFPTGNATCVYDKGVNERAFDNTSTTTCQSPMWWSGSLRFTNLP
jgi:hypothetical protein